MSGVLDLGELDAPVFLYGGTYSNRQATEAALAAAGRLSIPPARRIHTGDIVAYCGDPVGTTDLVMAEGGHVVLGNCEESFGAGAADCGCGFEEGSACEVLARDWYAHADALLRADQRAFMAACPGEIRFRLGGLRFSAVHGGFSAVNRFVFPTDAGAMAAELALTDADVVIAGHSGVPFAAEPLPGRHWVNAGVVGMPFNDGRPETAFAVLESSADGVALTFHRLAFDHRGAAAEMRRAGLPGGYADALESGFWPNMDVMPAAMRQYRGAPLPLTSRLIPRPGRAAA